MDVAARDRAYLRVAGPDACDYLQRMVSNDVEALQPGESCQALLLTAKARLIAPLVVWRRGDDDFLLLTEPELGEPVRALLTRMRLRAKCDIEAETHTSALVFGGEGIVSDFPGAAEVLDAELESTLATEELERRRIEARVPRWGRDGLRVLELADVPGYDAELVHDGKVVGRVTSATRRADGSVVALAYVRVEVPEDAALELAHAAA